MKLTPERRIELADPDKWTAQDSLDALETIDALTADLASTREREQAEWKSWVMTNKELQTTLDFVAKTDSVSAGALMMHIDGLFARGQTIEAAAYRKAAEACENEKRCYADSHRTHDAFCHDQDIAAINALASPSAQSALDEMIAELKVQVIAEAIEAIEKHPVPSGSYEFDAALAEHDTAVIAELNIKLKSAEALVRGYRAQDQFWLKQVAGLKAQTAAMLEKAAAEAQRLANEITCHLIAPSIRALITADQAAALADREKRARETALRQSGDWFLNWCDRAGVKVEESNIRQGMAALLDAPGSPSPRLYTEAEVTERVRESAQTMRDRCAIEAYKAYRAGDNAMQMAAAAASNNIRALPPICQKCQGKGCIKWKEPHVECSKPCPDCAASGTPEEPNVDR